MFSDLGKEKLVPLKAEQSSTFDNKGAEYSIDGDLNFNTHTECFGHQYLRITYNATWYLFFPTDSTSSNQYPKL